MPSPRHRRRRPWAEFEAAADEAGLVGVAAVAERLGVKAASLERTRAEGTVSVAYFERLALRVPVQRPDVGELDPLTPAELAAADVLLARLAVEERVEGLRAEVASACDAVALALDGAHGPALAEARRRLRQDLDALGDLARCAHELALHSPHAA